MTESDWGRWLIDDIESTDVETITCWYLGCNGFAIKAPDDTIIYIDPYLGLGDPPRTIRMIPVPFDPDAPAMADGILITHEHTDHLHGPSQGPILAATDAPLYGHPDAVSLARERGWRDEYDLAGDQLQAIEAGASISIGDIDIDTFAGTDPDAEADLTYVLTVDDVTIVHPGDGRPADTLDTIGERYDVAATIAAVGSAGYVPDKETGIPERTVWYNDGNDALEVAERLQADRLIPTHWDMWKGLTADPTALIEARRGMAFPRRIDALEIGDGLAITG